MKISFKFLITFFAGINIAFAAHDLNISQGKVLGRWSFMNSISYGKRASKIIREIYKKSIYNNSINKKLVKELIEIKDLHFSQHYSFHGYPKKRREMSWDVNQFFTLQAAKAKDLNDFFGRTAQVLPPSEHRRIFEIIKHFEKIYNELVWKDSKNKLDKYQNKLEKIIKKSNISTLLGKIIKFYNSNWPDTVPINIVIYPIPAKKGHTSATMISDTALLEALVDEKDIKGRLGVIFHEISHSIYESQSKSLQKDIDNFFQNSKSEYSKYTYNLLNEGLATAVGNGWIYKKLSGHLDKSDWYSNREINLFAKGIYPIVKKYIEAGKAIDNNFLKYSVDKYKKLFPKALNSYYNLLRNVWLGADSSFDVEEVGYQLRNYFHIEGIQRSGPIKHKFTIRSFKRSKKSDAVVVVFKNIKQFKWFSSKIKKLKGYSKKITNFKKSGVFTFFDKDKRPYLIFKIKNLNEFKMLLKKLQKAIFMDDQENFITF